MAVALMVVKQAVKAVKAAVMTNVLHHVQEDVRIPVGVHVKVLAREKWNRFWMNKRFCYVA